MTRTHFQNALVFSGFDEPQPGMTVVVEGSKIVSVSKGGGPTLLPGDRTLDLAGRMLMPGMTIGHWHPEYPNANPSEVNDVFVSLERPPSYHAAMAVRNLQIALFSGFTSVVGAGCAYDIDVSLRMAIDEGVFSGPRITPAGHAIITTGSGNDRAKWWYNIRPDGSRGVFVVGAELYADGADAFKRGVRDEIRRGVEIVKIFPTGGHGAISSPVQRGLSRSELLVVIETAHERGARVRAHCVGSAAILECVQNGVDIIDHGDGLDDACIEAMVKAGTILVPSMSFLKTMLSLPKGDVHWATLEQIRKDFLHLVQYLPKAHAAGVTIVPGDDYGLGVLPHALGIYARDFQIHVEDVGISARDVLGWATVHGARMQQRADLGAIADGMTADLLVVEGDPVQDITILADPERTLSAIMIGGEFVKDVMGAALAKHAGSGAAARPGRPVSIVAFAGEKDRESAR